MYRCNWCGREVEVAADYCSKQCEYSDEAECFADMEDQQSSF